jgi:putative peptidoglycan lipid II flippase
MSVGKWVLYTPVKLNLPTRDRFSTGTQKRVESINAVVFFRGVIITKKATRSLAGIAGIVAVATLISKVFGLVREQVIAAAYGVGPVVNAFISCHRLFNSSSEILGLKPRRSRLALR